MEEQENKYTELRRLYEDDLSRWTWFVKLDDIAKNILLTEIAATASRVYYEGWHEGFGDAKKIYDRPLKLTA